MGSLRSQAHVREGDAVPLPLPLCLALCVLQLFATSFRWLEECCQMAGAETSSGVLLRGARSLMTVLCHARCLLTQFRPLLPLPVSFSSLVFSLFFFTPFFFSVLLCSLILQRFTRHLSVFFFYSLHSSFPLSNPSFFFYPEAILRVAFD